MAAIAMAMSLVVGWLTAGSTAVGAPAPVSISWGSPKVVGAGSTTLITPRYTKRKGVVVTRATVSVRQGSTWLARKKRSVRVPVGTYRVITQVTFRVRTNGSLGKPRTTTRSRMLRVVGPAAARPPAAAAAPRPSIAVRSSLETTSSACDNSSMVKADGTPWLCTFSDEFDGTVLDRTRWSPQLTAQGGYQIGADCYVDDPANISVGGGALSLTVRKLEQPFTCKGARPTDGQLQHTAGSVYSSFAQAGGRFEIRAAFPGTKVPGHHGALWLFPQNPVAPFPFSGEIDIAEMYSNWADRVIPNIQYGHWDPTVTNQACMIDDVSAFHTYTLEWTTTAMTIAYDGNVCVTHRIQTLSPDPFAGDFMLVLTQGLGADDNAVTATTPSVGTTKIDYVRVWK